VPVGSLWFPRIRHRHLRGSWSRRRFAKRLLDCGGSPSPPASHQWWIRACPYSLHWSLKGARCKLVKDVAGYFIADLHADEAARHIRALTFEQALAFADDGCDRVEQPAIELAFGSNLPLVIRSVKEADPTSVVSSRACGRPRAAPVAASRGPEGARIAIRQPPVLLSFASAVLHRTS
jgi:hypothetical protein